MNYEVAPSARAGFVEVQIELSPEDSAKVRHDRPTMSAGYVVPEGPAPTPRTKLRRLVHEAEFALGRLAHGSPAELRRAVDVLTVALEAVGEREATEAKREPSRSDRERHLLQRLANRSWRSTGRRLRGQGNAERDRDQARADRDMYKRRAARYEAVLAELPADCWPESEGAPAEAAKLVRRARLADIATVDEVARLRARVRVEAQDVDRLGVTRAHVEAWCAAKGRRAALTGGAPGAIAYLLNTWWSIPRATQWDILEQMAAFPLESDR